MIWNELIIHTSNEAVEAIANILNEHGANGVVIEDPNDLKRTKRDKFGELYDLDASKYPKEGVYIKSYFVDNDEWPNKEREIKQKINDLASIGIDLGNNKIWINTVHEEDWANEWKKYFKPIKVTERIVIVPSWESYDEKDKDDLLITIDPGMAFGTGTHPTTVLSLKALENYIQEGDIVLDVGSGSGILSIASSLLGAKHVYSYDLDEVAVKSTKANRELNNLTGKITVSQNDLLKNVQQKANVIVSNILAEILLLLIDDAWDNLYDNGYFITSGIITSKHNLVEDKLKDKGFKIIETKTKDDWVSIVAQK